MGESFDSNHRVDAACCREGRGVHHIQSERAVYCIEFVDHRVMRTRAHACRAHLVVGGIEDSVAVVADRVNTPHEPFDWLAATRSPGDGYPAGGHHLYCAGRGQGFGGMLHSATDMGLVAL